jgi:hypothetical protein
VTHDGVAVIAGPGAAPVPVQAFWDDHLAIDPASAGDPRWSLGYLCESVVDQHPSVAALHPESVNTARVWTCQRSPGRWEVFGALLRIGVGSSVVDNSDQGGIGARIHVETGRLGRAVRHGIDYLEGHDFEEFDRHPTTGVRIQGLVLPMWDEAVALCRRTCTIFPYFRLMGLDIAFTPDGPVVLEVEADPHSTHQAYFEKGLRTLLQTLVREWSV